MTKYDVLINQSRKKLDISVRGTLRTPSSKSLSHRALICASLSNGCSYLDNVLFSEDIEATINCLIALGARFEKINNSSVKVSGICNPFKKPVDLVSSTNATQDSYDTILNSNVNKFTESSNVVELYCNE